MQQKILIIFLFIISVESMSSQYNHACFQPSATDVSRYNLQLNCEEDTSIIINGYTNITGLFLSGSCSLDNKYDSYARVIATDTYNTKYLVYEFFPMLADTTFVTFSKTALETSLLNGVNMTSIDISLKNASITIDSIYTSNLTVNPNLLLSQMASNNIIQNQYIAAKLNNQLIQTGKSWRAGVTDFSLLSFDEKSNMFGGNLPQLYGFDYYVGGVFVFPNYEETLMEHLNAPYVNLYVNEWDWRNRHGRNWMTSVKNQGVCGSCWAFSSISTVEAYINLYFNQGINYNLSEQEILSSGMAGNCSGGRLFDALSYIKNSGVLTEDCFPYVGYVCNFNNKCDNPTDIMKISNFSQVLLNEDSVRTKLFSSPICFGIRGWNHFLTLVGYKTINGGPDEFYYRDNNSNSAIPISVASPLVGHPAWLIKNSWGTSWGVDGYGYVAMDISSAYGLYEIKGHVISTILDSADIVCEDVDGDGYFFWGVGTRPASCPSWAPVEEDGDDSDYSKGPIDSFGFLRNINPNENDTIYVNSDTVYSSMYTHNHIVIRNSANLVITDTLTCYEGVKIIVTSGSCLSINGGMVNNAILQFDPNSQLIISDGGKIFYNEKEPFIVPKGVFVINRKGIIQKFIKK